MTAPRSDPCERNSRTRLPPWVSDGEALVAACRMRSGACDTVAPVLCPVRALPVRISLGPLQLTPDQDRYWPAIEEAIRSRAKDRQTRLEIVTTGAAERADRGPIENLRDRNPVEFLNWRADALAQRSADLKKLATAWQPLYQTMTPDQKRRMGFVAVYVLRELRDSAEERRIQAAEEED